MTKSKWLKVKRKGFKRYVLLYGSLYGGVILGLICLFLTYLANVDYDFSDFEIIEFIMDYLIWLPAIISYGTALAAYNWFELKKKYDDN